MSFIGINVGVFLHRLAYSAQYDLGWEASSVRTKVGCKKYYTCIQRGGQFFWILTYILNGWLQTSHFE